MILADVIPPEILNAAIQSGFNGLLVILLLAILYMWRKDEKAEARENRKMQELLARSVNDVLLAMAFLPVQFHDSAKARNREMDSSHEKQ